MSPTRSGRPSGREDELRRLEEHLGRARQANGGTFLLTGEPGIGKTRLVDAFCEIAEASGVRVLKGKAAADSAEPFALVADALKDLLPDGLAPDRGKVRFECVLALDAHGGVIAAHPDKGPSHDSLAGVISSVQAFVRDSFSSEKGRLGRLEYGEVKIVLEHGASASVAGIVRGDVAEGMHSALKSALAKLEADAPIVESGNVQPADAALMTGNLRALGEAEFYSTPKSDGPTLETERAKAAEAVAKALMAAAQADPVALVLEDAHWADTGSLFVLSYLARNTRSSRLAVLATARMEGAFTAAREAMLAEETVGEIALAGLTEDGVADLVENLCPHHAFGDAFVAKLASDSKGNPLFVVEAIKQLKAEGAITLESGTHVLSMQGRSIPSSVEDVVRRRLDSLEPDALAMAEYAACAGVEFDLATVLATEAVAEPRTAFDALSKSGIVALEGGRWRFAHALFQHVTYDGISPRWLAAHHRSLGAYYERAHAANLDGALFELARHFKGSGERGKALDYCERAGDKAAASLAVEKALEFYGGALEALGEGADRKRWSSITAKLGSAEMRLGNLDRALERLDAAVKARSLEGAQRLHAALDMKTIFRVKGEASKAVEAMDEGAEGLTGASLDERVGYLVEWGIACLEAGRKQEARAKVAEAAAAIGDVGSPARRSSVYMAMGILARGEGRFPEADASLRKAVEEADASGEPGAIVRAFELLGNYLHHRGLYKDASEMLHKAAAQSEKVGDVVALARVISNLGMVVSDSGDLDGSVAHLKRAVALLRRTGSVGPLASTLGNLGYTYAVMGRNEDALSYQMESLALREKSGRPDATAWCHYDLSIVHENLGNFAEAETSLRHCISVWNPVAEPMGYASAETMLAVILRNTGREVEARALFESSLEHSKPASLKAVEFSALVGLLRGDWSREAELMPVLERLSQELGDSMMMMEVAAVKAEHMLAAGDAEGGLAHIARGLELRREAKRSELNVGVADLLVLRSQAEEALGRRTEARESLREAVRLYEGRGRTWMAEKVRKRLDEMTSG